MNNLTRVLMGSASAAAILFGAQTAALADSISPSSGGTITYGAGGTATDNSADPSGGGVEIQTVDNDTVNIDSAIINKSLSGPTNDALNIINGGTGTLNVTFSGAGSSLTEQSVDNGAALTVDNSGAAGAVSLDTSGASSPNLFEGTNGIVVKGTGYANVVLGADNILAMADGTGSTTAGLSVLTGGETDIATAATIGSQSGGHLFDYGINLSPADSSSTSFITLDAAAHISAATADINITNGSVTIDQYGTLDTATKSIVLTGGGTANINLYAGSTTGDIDLSGDNSGGTSVVSLYTGNVNTDAVMDAQTGQIKQFTGANAAAVFGSITGSGSDELDLRGNGDGLGGGDVGQIDLSSTGGISGFGTIGKKDTGTWQFTNLAGDAASVQTAAIFLEQGTIQAMDAGAFGSGTIHVDNTGGFSNIELSASGDYSNNIALNVSSPTLASGAHIFVDSGITANLTGAITEDTAGQTIVFNGPGTAVLSNANNVWTGGTQISGNGVVSIGSVANIGTGNITLGSTSGTTGTLQYTHSSGGAVETATQNFVLNTGGGTIDVVTDGLDVNGTISGGGSLTKTGAGTLTLYGVNTYTGVTNISAGTLALNFMTVSSTPVDASIASSSAVNLTGATAVLDVSSVQNAADVVHNLSGVAGSQVNFGSKGLTITNNTATTFAGSLTGGSGDLTINGNGTLSLTGANTYTGLTVLNSGELDLTGTGSLASGNDVEINGGTFKVATTGQVLGNITGTSGNLTLVDGSNLNATAVSGNHTITLQGNTEFTVQALTGGGALVFDSSANAADIVVGDADDTIYSGNISSVVSGTGAIYKEGTGRLTLSGNNTNYTGYIQIDDGTVQAGSTTAFGGIYAYVGAGTTLDLNGFNNAIYSLHGPGTVTDSSTTPVTLELYNGSSNGSVFSGTIQDGAGKTAIQIDGGTLTLTGANTYTGTTTIGSGAGLVLSGSGSLASTNNIVDSGTFDVATTGQVVGNITGTGSLALEQDADLTAASLSGSHAVTLASNSTLNVGALSGNGSIVIGNGAHDEALLEAGDATNTTYSGDISSQVTGTGAFFKNGTGTLTLSGNNTNYTGYIQMNAGTLQAGSTTAFGGVYAYVGAGTTLDLNGFNNAIYSLHGPGTVTDSSTTPVTLELYNGSSNGSVFSGVIQDGAGKTSIQIDGGTLTATNANTYSGTTTIESGASVVLTGNGSIANSSVNDLGTFDATAATTPAGATLASLSGNGTANVGAATLTITNGTGVFSGTLTGTGGVTVTGGVFTAGTNASMASGNITLAGGGLGYGDGIDLANTIVIAGDNAQLDVETGTATQSGTITETGGPRDLDKTGDGILIIGTPVAYTGTTDVEAGTLRAGVANAFASSSNIIVADGATLDLGGFDQSVGELSGAGDIDIGSSQFTVGSDNASTTFSGVLSGTGSLVKTGTGTLTLSGDNTYSGGTTIQGGAIDAENDHAFGTGAVTMSDPVLLYGNGITIANSVILAANDAQLGVVTGKATQAGVISETGGSRPLEKIGAGELVLSATNTYTGATTVSAGTLTVTGSIASSSLTTVKSGATLGGSGTVGDVSVASGATLAPGSGNPAATLSVSGDLKLASGSKYAVAINPTTSSQAKVSGTATLGGATVNATYGTGSYVKKEYTILTAGSVSGTFGSAVNTNLPSNFETSLSYDATHAYLDLKLSFVPPSAPGFGNGLSNNQNAVGNTLIAYFNSTGSIPLVFGSLTAAGLTQVSGEIATADAQASADAQEQFLNVMLNPAIAGRDPNTLTVASSETGEPGDVRPAQTNGNGPHVWAAVYGGARSTDGSTSSGSNDSDSHNYGIAAGIDYAFSPDLTAGLAVSGGKTSFAVTQAGSGHADVYQVGAFVHQNIGEAGYITGAVAYGTQDVSTNRDVTSGAAGRLHGHYSDDLYSGRVEAGWRFDAENFGLTPYVALQATSEHTPGYSEKATTGASTFALDYKGTDFDSSRGEIGVRADRSFDLDDGVLTMRGRAAWADNFQIDHSIDASFQSLPGTAFTVDGASQGRNAALTSVSAEWKWASGVSFVASVDGGFSNKSTSYAGSGVVRFTW